MPPLPESCTPRWCLTTGLLSNLDDDRFRRVLAPKVKGADNLDSLTRGMALDYFVLFSSAITLMGNPGQANYVAANAYMEGVARRRRQARARGAGDRLGADHRCRRAGAFRAAAIAVQKLTGVRGMRASEALDLMAQALAQPAAPALAVITISPTEGIFTADRLGGSGIADLCQFCPRRRRRTPTATAISICTQSPRPKASKRPTRIDRRHRRAVGAGPACAGGRNQPRSPAWRNRARLADGAGICNESRGILWHPCVADECDWKSDRCGPRQRDYLSAQSGTRRTKAQWSRPSPTGISSKFEPRQLASWRRS